MKTFCVAFDSSVLGEVIIDKDRAHYIKNVMRLKIGAELILFNTKDKQKYQAEIVSFNEEDVVLKVSSKIFLSADDGAEVFLAFALLKGNNSDLLIKKAVEVGVKGFVPFISERTIATVKKTGNKRDRWEKLIISAVEQSKSKTIPFLDGLKNSSELLALMDDFDTVLIGDASLDSVNLSDIDFKDQNKVLVVVGPEGGFSVSEMEKLKSKGKSFSFGENVLRAETAGIVLPALVINEIKRQKAEH